MMDVANRPWLRAVAAVAACAFLLAATLLTAGDADARRRWVIVGRNDEPCVVEDDSEDTANQQSALSGESGTDSGDRYGNWDQAGSIRNKWLVEIYDILTYGFGLSTSAAAGMLSNMLAECGLNPRGSEEAYYPKGIVHEFAYKDGVYQPDDYSLLSIPPYGFCVYPGGTACYNLGRARMTDGWTWDDMIAWEAAGAEGGQVGGGGLSQTTPITKYTNWYSSDAGKAQLEAYRKLWGDDLSKLAGGSSSGTSATSDGTESKTASKASSASGYDHADQQWEVWGIAAQMVFNMGPASPETDPMFSYLNNGGSYTNWGVDHYGPWKDGPWYETDGTVHYDMPYYNVVDWFTDESAGAAYRSAVQYQYQVLHGGYPSQYGGTDNARTAPSIPDQNGNTADTRYDMAPVIEDWLVQNCGGYRHADKSVVEAWVAARVAVKGGADPASVYSELSSGGSSDDEDDDGCEPLEEETLPNGMWPWLVKAKEFSADQTIGYDQVSRYHNPNMDCSSFVSYCLIESGVPSLADYPVTSTHYMDEHLTGNGFTRHALTSYADCVDGAVLLNPQTHTEFFYGWVDMDTGKANWEAGVSRGGNSLTKIKSAGFTQAMTIGAHSGGAWYDDEGNVHYGSYPADGDNNPSVDSKFPWIGGEVGAVPVSDDACGFEFFYTPDNVRDISASPLYDRSGQSATGDDGGVGNIADAELRNAVSAAKWTAQLGMCLGFVSDVYENLGYNVTRYGAAKETLGVWATSTDLSSIRKGMCITVGDYGGLWGAGHIGIITESNGIDSHVVELWSYMDTRTLQVVSHRTVGDWLSSDQYAGSTIMWGFPPEVRAAASSGK